ncbi:MAG: LacI family DNA-binding transcriptional regulator [Phycisphaeraceae bacterium]
MAVSIQTIAEETGFSRSTVGHVLAGRGDELKVAPRTQQIVLDAARRLGYRPSFFAASLRKGQADLIIVLGSASRSQWRRQRQQRTTEVLFEAGQRVQLFDWRWGRAQSQRFFDLLADLQPRGLIVSEVHGQGRMLAKLHAAGTVMVCGDGPRHGIPELEIDSVHLDRQEVGRLAMHHLLELGHQRIVCVQSRNPRAWELRDRSIGYHRALKDAQLPTSALRHVWCADEQSQDDLADGYRSMGAVLRLDPRPTGVIASNDRVAMGILKACADHGVRVPQDMSVIGAEDHAIGAYLPQPLTTLRFPIEAMAQTAASLLQQRLGGSTAPRQSLSMTPQLLPRATTAPPFMTGVSNA